VRFRVAEDCLDRGSVAPCDADFPRQPKTSSFRTCSDRPWSPHHACVGDAVVSSGSPMLAPPRALPSAMYNRPEPPRTVTPISFPDTCPGSYRGPPPLARPFRTALSPTTATSSTAASAQPPPAARPFRTALSPTTATRSTAASAQPPPPAQSKVRPRPSVPAETVRSPLLPPTGLSALRLPLFSAALGQALPF
jgi:hypothetical protein